VSVSPTGTPTSAATPAPTVVGTATATATVEPAPISVFVAGEYELQPGEELLVYSVRYSEFFPSDQLPDRLDRVYRGEDGEVHVETVLTPEKLGGLPFAPYIDPVAVSSSGEKLATTVCARGYCGGFTPPDEDAVAALYLSSDGGETWRHEADFDGGVRVRDWLDGEVVLWRGWFSEDDPPPADQRLWLYPSGAPVLAPEGAAGEHPSPSVYESPYGPLWRAADGLVDAAGQIVLAFPGPPGTRSAGAAVLPDGTAFWTWTTATGSGAQFGALFDADGGQVTPKLAVPYSCCSATPDGRLLVPEVVPLPEWVEAYADELPELQDGEPYARWVPGFLDPETGAIEAITDPFMKAAFQDRDQIRVMAVVPIARAEAVGAGDLVLPVEGAPFGAADLMAALAKAGLGYGPQDHGVSCVGAGALGAAYGTAGYDGDPGAPGFTLWTYESPEALGADWELPASGPPSTKLDYCPLGSGFVYWNENLLLVFDEPRIWEGYEELREMIVRAFLALEPR
jgi:hypothetical protein